MIERLRPGPLFVQQLRHWTSEQLVVSIGVLLALWAQARFESQRDAGDHLETIAQLDRMFHRTLVVAAARVSTADCSPGQPPTRRWIVTACCGPPCRYQAVPRHPHQGLRSGRPRALRRIRHA